MKMLFYKELKLALHPTALLFLALSAMLLIPNYPYYVIFFYTALGIFFICLTGRENHDIDYSVSLPIAKKSIVSARFLLAVCLQISQILLAIPFAILRQHMELVPPNQAGIEANIAFFGLSLILLAFFNYLFFPYYYEHPDKVGVAFVRSSIGMGIFMILAETSVFAIPFMRNCIDTMDNQFVGFKLIFLGAGLLIYLLLTVLSYRKSVTSFATLDL